MVISSSTPNNPFIPLLLDRVSAAEFDSSKSKEVESWLIPRIKEVIDSTGVHGGLTTMFHMGRFSDSSFMSRLWSTVCIADFLARYCLRDDSGSSDIPMSSVFRAASPFDPNFSEHIPTKRWYIDLRNHYNEMRDDLWKNSKVKIAFYRTFREDLFMAKQVLLRFACAWKASGCDPKWVNLHFICNKIPLLEVLMKGCSRKRFRETPLEEIINVSTLSDVDKGLPANIQWRDNQIVSHPPESDLEIDLELDSLSDPFDFGIDTDLFGDRDDDNNPADGLRTNFDSNSDNGQDNSVDQRMHKQSFSDDNEADDDGEGYAEEHDLGGEDEVPVSAEESEVGDETTKDAQDQANPGGNNISERANGSEEATVDEEVGADSAIDDEGNGSKDEGASNALRKRRHSSYGPGPRQQRPRTVPAPTNIHFEEDTDIPARPQPSIFAKPGAVEAGIVGDENNEQLSEGQMFDERAVEFRTESANLPVIHIETFHDPSGNIAPGPVKYTEEGQRKVYGVGSGYLQQSVDRRLAKVLCCPTTKAYVYFFKDATHRPHWVCSREESREYLLKLLDVDTDLKVIGTSQLCRPVKVINDSSISEGLREGNKEESDFIFILDQTELFKSYYGDLEELNFPTAKWMEFFDKEGPKRDLHGRNFRFGHHDLGFGREGVSMSAHASQDEGLEFVMGKPQIIGNREMAATLGPLVDRTTLLMDATCFENGERLMNDDERDSVFGDFLRRMTNSKHSRFESYTVVRQPLGRRLAVLGGRCRFQGTSRLVRLEVWSIPVCPHHIDSPNPRFHQHRDSPKSVIYVIQSMISGTATAQIA